MIEFARRLWFNNGCISAGTQFFFAFRKEPEPVNDKVVGDGITFDDVLLVPAESDVVPSQVRTDTKLTREIDLNLPLVSAAMDTVTESALAIALAQEGGIGIIHKNLSVAGQALEVAKVKRSEAGVIYDPVTLPPGETIARALELMEQHRISGIPIVDSGRLVGILTNRDLRFHPDSSRLIAEVMTKDLITAKPDTTPDEAKEILHQNKIEKLLLTDGDRRLKGLITIKDIEKLNQFPNASRDSRGRLKTGAAVGPDDMERVEALIEADVDVICVDTAHGHSRGVLECVRQIKKNFAIQVIAGNVATADGARALADAGADAVKVGIGPGSICTTRVVTGVGVPQITAVRECAKAVGDEVPIIADGGIRFSGDLAKAIAAGAHCVMIGSLFAGMEESPGEVIYYKGRSFKMCRGMGSLGAMVKGSSDRYGQKGARPDKLVPEGVEGRVPYKGPLADYVYQLVGGLRASMGYCGAPTIRMMREKARFIRVSGASLVESHPHDITITKEAPNYSLEVDEV
jgi:IMP dehydrogenase